MYQYITRKNLYPQFCSEELLLSLLNNFVQAAILLSHPSKRHDTLEVAIRLQLLPVRSFGTSFGNFLDVHSRVVHLKDAHACRAPSRATGAFPRAIQECASWRWCATARWLSVNSSLGHNTLKRPSMADLKNSFSSPNGFNCREAPVAPASIFGKDSGNKQASFR